ncbi:MAG: GMC family oxidoreductase [Candidatus Abyssobacteria bacterium SURF_17]|uniref:GMC family oxidoreductase n=1 Tax=Candidatus Abyssobacteria bacterium SURF_17 TaxID=2093361 RepID=A0A419EV83_9BACT|nr:MAG: GMC family oxidoreductase [Candidatus Abyssubacteria bacterium SURF_17]
MSPANHQTIRIEADAVVVGTGPGGATVGRELARAGKRVVFIEGGRHPNRIGSHLSILKHIDRGGLVYSEEGLNVVRALATGGSTLVFTATACRPPAWLKDKYGIDITYEVNEAEEELKVTALPDELLGPANRRLMSAANELGYDWEPFRKFIDPDKCAPGCSDCILGCKRGAKWTAANYVADAVSRGAILLNRVAVREVITENGKAVGIRGHNALKTPVEVRAQRVIIAAGGMGTPVILQRSGIPEAGQGFFCDPLRMVYGVPRDKGVGSASAPQMSVGTYEHHEKDGFILSPIVEPWLLFGASIGLRNPRSLTKWVNYRSVLGIMVKIRDDMGGRINLDGSFSKPLTYDDRLKLDHGTRIAEKILEQAGCEVDDIFCTIDRGAHPGGTARVGHVVDKNLQTRVENLYLCDTSVIPEPWGLPPVLTCIGLGKRLAKHLFGQ